MRVILAGAAVVFLVVGIFLVRPDLLANVDYKVFDLLTRQVSRGRPSGRFRRDFLRFRSVAVTVLNLLYERGALAGPVNKRAL